MNALVWLLVTVTYGGEVKVSPPIPSQAACAEAASIALTGRTLAEEAQLDKAYHERCNKKWDTPACGGGGGVTYNSGQRQPEWRRGWYFPKDGDVKWARCFALPRKDVK
jgi:siroheme synthase